jgi:hypothetical protein
MFKNRKLQCCVGLQRQYQQYPLLRIGTFLESREATFRKASCYFQQVHYNWWLGSQTTEKLPKIIRSKQFSFLKLYVQATQTY